MPPTKRIAKTFARAASLALLLAPAACAEQDFDAGLDSESYADGGLLEDKALLATFQAEARTATQGCVVANNQAGYSGTGFMDYGSNGTWIEWNNVNVATAGSYQLTFRYGNGGANPRACAAYVNGANVGNVAFNTMGSWTNWGTVSITTTLKAGNNTIRVMANTSTGGPNLDRMDLSGTATPPPPPPGPNPYCESGSAGEQSDQRETGTLSYNNRSVSYEMRGGVIKTKHSPNACVATSVSSGQTQLVALGTSDGGCTSCLVGQPVDKALMGNQGFSLVKVVGDQDARSEVWARVFDTAKSNHRSTIAISGDSNALAWVIATVGTALNTSALASNAVSTGSGKSLSDSQLSLSGYQSSGFQFKFLAGFLDDTCSVEEEEEEDHMLSFWRQGDGDTFFVGMWGAGESAKSRLRMQPLEDSSFDVAIIATGANP